MSRDWNSLGYLVVCSALCAFLGPGASGVAGAQSLAAATVEVASAAPVLVTEVDRSPNELSDRLRTHPDRDVVDTALVFTNYSGRVAYIKCRALDGGGHTIGAVRLRVPAHGVRFALASDASHGRDFVGSVRCAVYGHVVPSAIVLGPGALTDVKAIKQNRGTQIRFPLVATY